MKYTCPVCGFDDLESDPRLGAQEICPTCEIQFGLDDVPEPRQSSGFEVNRSGVASSREFENPKPLCTRESLWAAWRDTWLKRRVP